MPDSASDIALLNRPHALASPQCWVHPALEWVVVFTIQLISAPLHVAKVRELVVEPLTKADLIKLGKAAEAITDRLGKSG
jgi:hypothetical protein